MTRWHPATEIVALGCALLLVFGLASPLVPAALILVTVLAVAAAPAIRFRSWLVAVALICLPTLLFAMVVQGFFYRGADPIILWDAGIAQFTLQGAAIAVQLWLRLTAMVGLCAAFGLGNDSARLFDGLTRLRVPQPIAYVCAAALGLIPLVRTRTVQMLEARSCRGWDTRSWAVRIRLIPTLVPGLFTAVLMGVEQRFDTLTQRGFGAPGQRGAGGGRPTELQDHPDSAASRAVRWILPLGAVAFIAAVMTGLIPLPSAQQLLEVITR